MALIYPGGGGSTSFTDGFSNHFWQPENNEYGSHFVLASAGTVTQLGVHGWSSSATPAVKIMLYDGSGNLIGSSSVTFAGTTQWYDTGALSLSIPSAGTYYILCSAETTWAQYGYDTAGHGSAAIRAYASAPADPETILHEIEVDTLYGVRMDFTASGGGTTYSRDRAESVALSDAQTSVAVFGSTRAESVALSHTQTAIAVFGSARAESVALSHTQIAALILLNTRAESLALSDVQAAQTIFGNVRAESLAMSDAQTAIAAFSNARAESFTLSEAQVSQTIFESAIAETFAIVDAQSGDTALVSTVAELLGISDAQVVQAIFENASTETFALADIQSTSGSTFNAAVNEAVALLSVQTGDVTGDTTIDIMNPYIVVYMWKRTG